MKKLFILALFPFLLGSCMYSGYYGKRPIFLIDAPTDLKVKRNGKYIDVKYETAEVVKDFAGPSSPSGGRTIYKHQCVLFKTKRRNVLELEHGGKTVKVNVKGTLTKGIFVMLLETPFTLGIGTIVDLATTSYYVPKPKYLDVYAAFNGTTPRTKKELYKVMLRNSEQFYSR